MIRRAIKLTVPAIVVGVFGAASAYAEVAPLANLSPVTSQVASDPSGATISSTMVVRTKDELLAALAGATAGDTVFVDGSVSINLTGHKRIVIPAGVTLASNRGENGAPGGLLYNTELDAGQPEVWAQFSPQGSQVRITGLRLRGPDTEIRSNAYQYDNSRGIEAVGASDLTVDNNELYGWSHAAVYLGDTIEGRIRGNYLHHNRRTGLGYGVVLVNDSSAVIEDNTFDENRHAIAGTGIRTQRYEARFNLVLDNANGHAFDMHGENEALGNGAPYAGDVIHIKHNSFRSSAQPAVVIRGRPATGAWVSGNCFAHSGSSSAVQQKNFSGNLWVGSNTYSSQTGGCHQTGRRIEWRLSSAGTSNWSSLAPYTFDVSEVGFGDFNGDGRTDVFRATGSRWYYSPGGQGPFVAGASTSTRLPQLRFGDFDGDGATDVFTVINGRWHFSPRATGSWQPLATSGEPLASLRFGDFDGDGRTDVFRTNGTRWYYSSAGQGSWVPLALSGASIESLRFGDFNGDGRTDVFQTSGGRWYYSSAGQTSWIPLALSGASIDSLRFGDFNGDGRTDVFQTDDGRWYYSSAGQTSWIPLALSSCPLASLHIADFTGDGKADVFDGRCGG